jgi:hypothetical protein
LQSILAGDGRTRKSDTKTVHLPQLFEMIQSLRDLYARNDGFVPLNVPLFPKIWQRNNFFILYIVERNSISSVLKVSEA